MLLDGSISIEQKEALGRPLSCLASLPNLRKITLWSLPDVSYKGGWERLVAAFQSREQLEEANIFQGNTSYGDRVVTPMSEEELDAIQFRPRLNDATANFASGGRFPESLEEFVNAVVSVRDREDCLDYFFSSVDPNLFAPSAIANLKKRGQRHVG